MTFETVFSAAQVLTPVVLAVIGFVIRNAMGRVTDRIARVEVRTEQAERDIEFLRETAVRREEWIREMARTRITMEKLVEGQAHLEGKLDSNVRMAAALEMIGARMSHGEDAA